MLIQLNSQSDMHEMLRVYLNYSLSMHPVTLDSPVDNYKMQVILSFRSKDNIIDHISVFLIKILAGHKNQKWIYLIKTTVADFRREVSFPPPGARTDWHKKTLHLEDTGHIGPRTLLKRWRLQASCR
jgi:hypothetical protein